MRNMLHTPDITLDMLLDVVKGVEEIAATFKNRMIQICQVLSQDKSIFEVYEKSDDVREILKRILPARERGDLHNWQYPQKLNSSWEVRRFLRRKFPSVGRRKVSALISWSEEHLKHLTYFRRTLICCNVDSNELHTPREIDWREGAEAGSWRKRSLRSPV
jgi:hypothetical protein